MILNSHIEWMIFQLHDLHSHGIRVMPHKNHAGIFKFRDKVGVDFIAVPMTFFHRRFVPVQLPHDGILSLENSLSLAQSHGTSQLALIMLRHVYDHGVRRIRINFGGISIGFAQDVPGKLYRASKMFSFSYAVNDR